MKKFARRQCIFFSDRYLYEFYDPMGNCFVCSSFNDEKIDEAVLIPRIEAFLAAHEQFRDKMVLLLKLAAKHWYKRLGIWLLQHSYNLFAAEDKYRLILLMYTH